MDKITEGKWELEQNKFGDWLIIASEELKHSAVADIPQNNDNALPNANFIVTCQNACYGINPENPQAVADQIGEMVEVCGLALQFFIEWDTQNKVVSGLSLRLNNVLAKIKEVE